MPPISFFDMSLPNFNEMCFVCLGLIFVFLAGLLVMDGLGHLWMRITGRDEE